MPIVPKLNPGESFDTSTQPCLNCGKALDMACCVTDQEARPTNGDLNICFYCGHFMSYTDDGVFRNLTDEEMTDVAGDPQLMKIMEALGEAQDNYKKKNTSV